MTMNLRSAIGRVMGIFFVGQGVLILFLLSSRIGRIIGGTDLLPTFNVSSSGFGFSTGTLPLILEVVFLIPAGIFLAWKLKKLGAILGIAGVLILPIVSIALQILVSVSGGPPITELIDPSEIIFGVGVFVGLPIVGTVLAWKELH